MKKIVVISIILLLALMMGVSHAELPAPFERIKQHAIQSGLKMEGMYYLEFRGEENGNEFILAFIYNPDSDIVAIVALTRETGRSPTCVRWNGGKKVYERIHFTPLGAAIEEITEREAVDSAYVIMRIAVRLKLIKQETEI